MLNRKITDRENAGTENTNYGNYRSEKAGTKNTDLENIDE